MNNKCIICGSEQSKRLTGRAGWEVRICSDCANALTVPAPTTDRQYDDHSFFQIPVEGALRWRHAAGDLIKFIHDNGCRGTFLDVGCGNGFAIEAALAAGFEAQGIEASQSAVISGRDRGLQIQVGYYQDNTFPDNTFDVILMNHVLEHSANPRTMLMSAHKHLKPNGYLCLGQTNYLGTMPRLLGARWYAWVPKEHYVHFSVQGVTRLLQNAHFQVKSTRLTTLFWDWENILASTLRHWPGIMLHNFAAFVNQTRLGFPFVGDQFNVLAQKQEGNR